jgi:uncharacterized protein YuzE
VSAILRVAAETSGANPNGVHLNLTDQPINDSEEVADGIVVDYADEGRIVGIEILDASKCRADPAALKQFGFEEA